MNTNLKEHFRNLNADFNDIIAENQNQIAGCDTWAEASAFSKINFKLLQLGRTNVIMMKNIDKQRLKNEGIKKRPIRIGNPANFKVFTPSVINKTEIEFDLEIDQKLEDFESNQKPNP